MGSDKALPSYPINTVDLDSGKDSKIISVNLYWGRAEISRLFKVSVNAGQNQLVIKGLPNVLDQASLKVEGRGAATIHDVTIAREVPPEPLISSPRLTALLEEEEDVGKALGRAEESLKGLKGYLYSLSVDHVDVAQLSAVMEAYNNAAAKYDSQATALERKLEKLKTEIVAERAALAKPSAVNQALLMCTTIGVFAKSSGHVKIVLNYAVTYCSWEPEYDIRVDTTQTKESSVQLTYKASICQTTGESWDDVPITLETASPTYGVELPTLGPWNLSISRPPPKPARPILAGLKKGISQTQDTRSRSPSTASALEEEPEYCLEEKSHDYYPTAEPMTHAVSAVTSTGGGMTATFRVPGVITIPSDPASHNVTIVKLDLDAQLSWVSIPIADTRVYLTTKIQNTSEYNLLSGCASVYLDGSFISKSKIPAVSPQEQFYCSLGLDPSTRITYHPLVKKASQSGFYTKTSTTAFCQRITVLNTKSTTADRITIIDHIPVSKDSQISVKLISPEISPPAKLAAGVNGEVNAPLPVNVAKGVVAQWHGAGDADVDVGALGKDGKIDWVCSLAPQKTVNLLLQWEVSTPVRAVVVGL